MENNQVKEFVIRLLTENLSPFYYYHNLEHTLYVTDKAVKIGREEQCTKDEIILLTVAGLWHDTGLIKTYNGHEAAGCELIRKHLPAFGYSAKQIEKLCGMIMATKIPQSPNNKLEEIIADADVEYLGTEANQSRAYDLFRELQHMNPLLTKKEWNAIQISFLQKHHYFTRFCKENREQVKLNYLKTLVEENERL